MGKLTYGSGAMTAEFDDRLLAHLQIVIGAKLRRRESFLFSWQDANGVGDGRTTIWLDPSIPLVFKFYGGRLPSLNKRWIEDLSRAANSSGGLIALPEPSGSEVTV